VFLYCIVFLSNHNICKKYYQHGGIIAGTVYKIKKCRWRASYEKHLQN